MADGEDIQSLVCDDGTGMVKAVFAGEEAPRVEAIMAFRQLNLNPERPDSAYLRTPDTSSKQTTAVFRKLKQIDDEELEELMHVLRGVKVRISEAVYAICEANPYPSNKQAAVQICSLLHRRHKEFSPSLKQKLLKVFSPGKYAEDCVFIALKKQSNLELLLELYYAGVIEDSNIFISIIKDLTSVEQLKYRVMILYNLRTLVAFAERGRVFLGLPIPRQYEDGLDITAEQKNSCKKAFNTYYAALADLLQCEHKLLDQMEKENAKLVNAKGELSEDGASYEKLKYLFYELYDCIRTLAKSLDMQPPAKDGTIAESLDMQPPAKDCTTRLTADWICSDLRASFQADLLGEAEKTSNEQSAKAKDKSSEACTVELPDSVIEEILSRCEVEDLVRFRTVDKKINAFMYKLLRHQALEFFIRVDSNHTVQIMNPGTRVLHELATPEEFRGAEAVSSMVHCKGLVLCSFMDAKVAIWNPVLIEASWINPPSGGFTYYDFYGIGYDKASPDSYKVLRFIHRKQCMSYPMFGDDVKDEQKAEIYEFRTGIWKTVESERDWIIESWNKGLSVNGNMYWVAWKRLQKSSKPFAFIVSFDFSTEGFKYIVECPNNWKGKLRLSSFEGDRLSLIQQSFSTRDIEVWVTESSLGSFTKKFTLSGRIPKLVSQFWAEPVYTLEKNNTIMAWCLVECGQEGSFERYTYQKFVFCELCEEGGLSFRSTIVNRDEWKVEDRNDGFNVGYLYFPSLVPLPTVGSTPTALRIS